MASKLQAPTTAGFNAGKSYNIGFIKVQDIKIDPEIAGVFKREDELIEEIKNSIKKYGFFKEEPVVLTKDNDGNYILVDGHTRYTAALEEHLEEIPYVLKTFESYIEVLVYTINRQIMRRNLNNSELLAVVGMFEGHKEVRDGTGRNMEILGKKLGISPSKLFMVKAIAKKATPKVLKAYKNDEIATKTAYKTTLPKKPVNGSQEAAGSNPQNSETKCSDVPSHYKIAIFKSALTHLVESGQRAAAESLVNHFFRKNKNDKRELSCSLSDTVRAELALVFR